MGHRQQVIHGQRRLAADGGQRRILGCPSGPLAVAGHRHQLHIGQIALQPQRALRQRLRMRHHLPDIGHLSGPGHQHMSHRHRDLGRDPQRRVQEQVLSARHRPLGRVLDGHHPEIHRPGFRHPEHVVDGRTGHPFHGIAEARPHGLFAERAPGAQESHPQRPLQPPAGRHQLAPERTDRRIGQRPGVGCLQLADDGRLPFGAVDRGIVSALLQFTDALRQPRPLVDQRQQLLVQGVDVLPHPVDLIIRHLVPTLLSCSSAHANPGAIDATAPHFDRRFAPFLPRSLSEL